MRDVQEENLACAIFAPGSVEVWLSRCELDDRIDRDIVDALRALRDEGRPLRLDDNPLAHLDWLEAHGRYTHAHWTRHVQLVKVFHRLPAHTARAVAMRSPSFPPVDGDSD